MILNKFQYFYYRIYIWQLRSYGVVSAPSVTAQGIASILLLINTFTAANFLYLFTGYNFILHFSKFTKQFHFDKIQVLVLLFILYTLLEGILQEINYYDKIIKKYKHETPKEKIKGTFLIWCYIIGSISLMIISFYFDRNIKSR